ncbi:putative mitochondrial protein [Cucumis melo var. makuwa]|uniref:Mitochondrial protein n=1 Tax=Cucumis melo var. makuwa TaxID=1194695 RepID=A0A5D3DZJ7_CUCMM|nr:putative mitochondrial protein [Cucumis melo var. makuwa]TYK29042.1 putative mitochondrial protein [Cucumis melo var. makuwa]
MDDFEVALEMEFLLEHQVILVPLAKCLVITGSAPTVAKYFSKLDRWLGYYETPEFQATFDGLKQAMLEELVIGIADVTKPFEIEIDVFDYALDGVLL